jgi:hypothetical protein
LRRKLDSSRYTKPDSLRYTKPGHYEKIGSVRSARMGVLQITPADSNEVSDTGMNDTSSLEKDITAVVNVGFAVD